MTFDSSIQVNGTEKPLNRADEVKDLLDSIQDLIIPFIQAADSDAAIKHTGNCQKVNSEDGSARTALVEQHAPKELEKVLGLQIPERRSGKEGLLEVVKNVLRYSVNTWDQGFMDKLYASTNAVGLVSELLLATLNTNSHVYQVSPALTLIEKHTSKYLASLFGFTSPYSGGISQPGGSASNSTALVIARNTLFPETKTDGLGSLKLRLFTSAHGHYSLEKAAQMFGMGSNAVIPVPVDDKTGRMVPSELERLIQESKDRGETPFFVNATAGTTVLGSFDPIPAISSICRTHKLWLHIDGSWGGSVIFNRTLADDALRLKDSALADSIAITPHKMLGVPMTRSFLLVRDIRAVRKAMTLKAGYLFHVDDDGEEEVDKEVYDLADLTPQCGRRADSLKMFLSLSYYGSDYFSQLIQRGFENANYLLDLLKRNENFVSISPEPLPSWQVCFYFARGGRLSSDVSDVSRTTRIIVEGLVKRGFMVDYAPGDKGSFFRVVVSPNSLKGTLEGLVKGIEDVAVELGV